MRKIFNWVLAATLVCGASVFTSCSSDSDDATRIVSTDKKALKAGGLLLALAGVTVKPTDDVDAEKEYQLIPIE